MGFEEEPGSIEDEVDDGAARVTDGSPPTPWDLRYIRPCKQAAIAHFRSMLILRLAASKKVERNCLAQIVDMEEDGLEEDENEKFP
jgi:hypothetical protein